MLMNEDNSRKELVKKASTNILDTIIVGTFKKKIKLSKEKSNPNRAFTNPEQLGGLFVQSRE